MNYKEFFKDKKIAIVGLGPHAEMLVDIKFLLRCGAKVDVYDIRSDKRLKNISTELNKIGIDKIELGKINDSDLLNYELIILNLEVSRKSFFLKKAIDRGIQIEYSEVLFFKLAPSVTVVGVLGEYGKTTVSQLVFSIFKKGFAEYEDQGLYLIDSENASGILSHLKKIKKGDVVLAKIPEHLISHLYEIRISPHVAVVVSPVSLELLEYQTYNNFIVAPDIVVDNLKAQNNFSSKAKILRTRESMVSIEWELPSYPIYNYENIALALQTAELFKIPVEITKQVVQSFPGLKGRMEFVKKVDNVEFYNDASSITPSSTIAGLRSLYKKDSSKNIILIIGGAYTGRDYTQFVKELSEYVHSVVLISGSGVLGLSEEIENIEGIKLSRAISLEDAVIKAKEMATKGDRVLYSPAFEAVGVDLSRKERGEKFVKYVRNL